MTKSPYADTASAHTSAWWPASSSSSSWRSRRSACCAQTRRASRCRREQRVTCDSRQSRGPTPAALGVVGGAVGQCAGGAVGQCGGGAVELVLTRAKVAEGGGSSADVSRGQRLTTQPGGLQATPPPSFARRQFLDTRPTLRVLLPARQGSMPLRDPHLLTAASNTDMQAAVRSGARRRGVDDSHGPAVAERGAGWWWWWHAEWRTYGSRAPGHFCQPFPTGRLPFCQPSPTGQLPFC
eukprot:244017-Chlamydomonas_euryale.AAC.2